MKPYQISVMTTRRNLSSLSLVSQLGFFTRSVPVYLPCYIPPLVQNKWAVGGREEESSAWTPPHKNYKTEQGWTTLLGVFISGERLADRLGKDK